MFLGRKLWKFAVTSIESNSNEKWTTCKTRWRILQNKIKKPKIKLTSQNVPTVEKPWPQLPTRPKILKNTKPTVSRTSSLTNLARNMPKKTCSTTPGLRLRLCNVCALCRGKVASTKDYLLPAALHNSILLQGLLKTTPNHNNSLLMNAFT